MPKQLGIYEMVRHLYIEISWEYAETSAKNTKHLFITERLVLVFVFSDYCHAKCSYWAEREKSCFVASLLLSPHQQTCHGSYHQS